MTLPNLPREGRSATQRHYLASGSTFETVEKCLLENPRYKFLLTKAFPHKRFFGALKNLLAHYQKTHQAYKTHTRNSSSQKQAAKLRECAKTYETAIEQLLEKAYQDARKEDMKELVAQSDKNLHSSTRSNKFTSNLEEEYVNCEQGRRINFKKEQTKILNDWFVEHIDDPYPSPTTKAKLSEQSGLNFKQVSNWFINARSRKLSSQDKKRLRRVY
ncbi:hypothetical protein AAMO2058_000205300 [Amorphochlora amoebiformis]